MVPRNDTFVRSIDRQISLNRARTPSERLLALCALLDAARAMVPRGPDARVRCHRALRARERSREQLRANLRQLIAAARTNASA